jgi:hypothetical protein
MLETSMTRHPEFTVLLARQRSGTNALRAVLQSNPEIFCFDEVFAPADPVRLDAVQTHGNYFEFLREYAARDVSRAFPDRHEQILADYLVHLRGLTDKRLIIVDVKYNSTHHLDGPFRDLGEPALWGLIKARELAVLHLTRDHYLRCLVSHLKAWESKQYYVLDGTRPVDARVQVPVNWALNTMGQWQAEDQAVAAAFLGYEFYKRVEYTGLFPDATGSMAPGPLADLRAWFGVPDRFVTRPPFPRYSSLPLVETIENIDQVIDTLRGTRFEYCLDDEPAYRRAG